VRLYILIYLKQKKKAQWHLKKWVNLYMMLSELEIKQNNINNWQIQISLKQIDYILE